LINLLLNGSFEAITLAVNNSFELAARIVGRILLCWAQTEAADVLCGREYQNSIDDSVHKLLKGLIETLKVSGVNVTDKKIDFVTGGGFRYKGFARNSAAVRSSQGFKYSWIEEGQDLSEQSIEDLLPTIRAANSKLLFTANVMASNDPFSKRFINPFKRALDDHGYFEDDMHLTFNDSVDDSIILAEWFDAAIDAHIKLGFKPKGIKIVSHDPSDIGSDPKGLVLRHGSVILDVLERKEGDVNDGCDWATSFAINNNADWFIWDCDGLGVTLKRQVTDALDGTRTGLIMFKGSESPVDPKKIYMPDDRLERLQARTNEQTFRNKRAQYYMRLRDRFYKTYRAVVKGEYIDPEEMISVSSSIECMDQFRSECCRIPRKYNPNGFFQIMTKKEMKHLHKIESPNLADSAMQSMEIPRIFKQKEYEPFEIPNQKRL